MGTKTLLAILFAGLVSIVPSSGGSGQEGVPFGRAYKEGDKAVYTLTMSAPSVSQSTSVDIEYTVNKIVDGKPEILVHMANDQLIGEGPMKRTPLPPDRTIRMTSHNLPEHFTMAGKYEMVLLLAAFTADKTVKAGELNPITWTDDTGRFKFIGWSKVLEVSADSKKLKMLVKAKGAFRDQDAGDIALTTTYNLTDGSVIESEGHYDLADTVDFTFKYVRKS